MIAYAYILDLFTAVLNKSHAIKGRVYYAPHLGSEINSDELDQVIKDVVKPEQKTKYPLALIMPPASNGGANGWSYYPITMYFLKQSFISGLNQQQNKNVNTNTSQHAIWQDWHDMRRCAEAFTDALKKVTKNRLNSAIQISADKRQVSPVTFVGADRASGVMLQFQVSIFNDGCFDIEDYDFEDLVNFPLPAHDSHQEHKL